MRKVLAAIAFCAAFPSWAQVGMREVMSHDMHITLLYPTQAATQPLMRGPFQIDVALNAPPSTEARHLIVMSHGTAGSALSDFTLASTFVKAGFVVAQPEHRGDNFSDYSKAGPASWDTRPQEISETIDVVAQDAQWGQQLDLQHVGVHGMSAGGMTALVMAGAQWRMWDLIQHCGKHLDEDIGFCLNGALDADKQAMRRAQFQQALNIPEKYIPATLTALHGAPTPSSKSPDPRPDARVSAVSAVVPLSAVLTPESLARIAIPVGLTTSGKDELLVPQFHSGKVLRDCTRCTVLSDNPQAGHLDWLSPWPAAVAQKVGAQQVRGGELHPDFTPAQRQASFDRIPDFFKQSLAP